METKNKSGDIEYSLQKKNPKPNAPRYKLKTVEDIFEILTEENYKRFLKDFEILIESHLAMRILVKEVAKSEDIPSDLFRPLLKDFIWIDD